MDSAGRLFGSTQFRQPFQRERFMAGSGRMVRRGPPRWSMVRTKGNDGDCPAGPWRARSRWTLQGPAVNAAPMTENEFDAQEAGGPPGRAGRKKARRGKSGTRSVPATPHDNLFRALVSDPGRAAALIRDHLPNRITGLLSETPPVPLDGSFVDEALRGSQSDMLFRVELASGGPAFVYVLAEHKSHADPGTPLQLAGYMIRIWTRYAQGKAERLRALPPIVPVVFYHGEAGWSVAEGLGAMIATDDPELVFLPGERFILRVLTALPSEDLSRDAALKAGLIALAHRAIECFEMMAEGLVGNETLQVQVFEYILLTYPDADMDALRANLRAAGVDEMEGLMGTMAEALMEQGMERGHGTRPGARAWNEARSRA